MGIKRDLFIIHIAMEFGGGVGTVIKNLIKYQLRIDCKVGIIYPEWDSEYNNNFLNEFEGKIEKFPVNLKKTRGLNQIMGLPIHEIYEEIKFKNPKYRIILHAHNPAVVGMVKSIEKLPLLCTIHGVNTQKAYLSHIITKMILYKLKKNNYLIVGVSNQVSRYYNNVLGCEYIKSVLNGVEINPVESSYKFERFTIGYLAYINDLKGWHILFEAYNLLSSYYKERIDLVFAGEGSIEEVNKINALISINDLSQNVKYLGLVENAGNTLTPNLSLVVLPSSSEGLGMTLIEAIGNKIPILATNVGGIPEVLVDGQNGYFIERTADDIAEKICMVFDDKMLYEKLQRQSIKIYNDKFTIDKMGENYLSLYESIK